MSSDYPVQIDVTSAFQRGVLRWQARLVAYHASFVVEYPPWSLDTEPSLGEALAAAGAR